MRVAATGTQILQAAVLDPLVGHSHSEAERWHIRVVHTSPDTIVLIHGLWMTTLSWESWIERYSARGYRVSAPAWPGMDVGIEELRADPSRVQRLGIGEIVDHYDAIVRDLDEPPILMGDSFGGALTEILLDRSLGAAGVAIDAAGTGVC
jgi:pimeloyl-ACP methyl ester carboxylesterase